MEEDRLPVVRAEVVELFGETSLQSLDQRFKEHQTLFPEGEEGKGFKRKQMNSMIQMNNEF